MLPKRLKIISVLLAVLICLLAVQPVYSAGISDSGKEYLKGILEMINDKYQGEIDEEMLMEGVLRGIFDTLDNYTVFMTPDETDDYFDYLSGSYVGIGIEFQIRDDYAVIIDVYPSSPAEEAGLLPGDHIVEADGIAVSGMDAFELSMLIKGEPDSIVELGITRSGKKDILTLPVVRREVIIDPVSYKIKDGIGYIKLDRFDANAAASMEEALEVMDSRNITHIILDLRNNPGGYVDQAVRIAQHFVPRGLVTTLDFKSRYISDELYISDLEKTNYQVAVLVNGMSASASEILAGAIQDSRAGVLIGTKTYGKGVFQNLVPILTPEAVKKYQAELGTMVVDAFDLLYRFDRVALDSEIIGYAQMTMGYYKTPSGRIIDGKGLEPDILAEDPEMVGGVPVGDIKELKAIVKPGLNDEGVDVYNAEMILTLLGYELDKPDTVLDEKTFDAIKDFQREKGGYAYGRLDFTTQRWLNEELETLKYELDIQYNKAVNWLNSYLSDAKDPGGQ